MRGLNKKQQIDNLLSAKLFQGQTNPNHVTGALKIEAVAQRCSVKKVFLKNSQNSRENTSVGVSF